MVTCNKAQWMVAALAWNTASGGWPGRVLCEWFDDATRDEHPVPQSPLCCIGPGHIARKWAGRAGEFFQLHEEEPWGCLLSKGNASCISHIRQLLSCEKVRAIDIGSVDWLTMRENMWKALVFAREGSGEGFRQGLHRQLDKIAFEAEHGDFTLDMGRADWISKFRTLFAQHLLSHEEVPGCIVGHVTLQLFMVFFVDSRGHGVFRQELESASSAVNQSLEVTPICFSHMTAPQLWNQPNVLATRLSLFKAIRWMHLLESGWPIFKIFSLEAWHNDLAILYSKVIGPR
eukprot:g20964.t1